MENNKEVSQKIIEYFEKYFIWEVFRNKTSEILLTPFEIIIVNNNYDASDWGELHGENPHIYINFQNIIEISSNENIVYLKTNQFSMQFNLEFKLQQHENHIDNNVTDFGEFFVSKIEYLKNLKTDKKLRYGHTYECNEIKRT